MKNIKLFPINLKIIDERQKTEEFKFMKCEIFVIYLLFRNVVLLLSRVLFKNYFVILIVYRIFTKAG
jgi:hypothetical protein